MKTRTQIYGKEAAGLLRAVSLYPGLLGEQLCRLYPGKESAAKTILAKLEKQGRITPATNGGWFIYGSETQSFEPSIRRAVWVLLDFIEQVEFHSSSDFPTQVIFYAQGDVYEVIDIPAGQETLISQALRQSREEPGRRILIVDSPQQIHALNIPGVSAYCTVAGDGSINYYQKANLKGD